MTRYRCGRCWIDGRFEKNVLIETDGGVIARVVFDADPGDDEIDLGRLAIIPAPVNGHLHSFQSLLRGVGDDLAFSGWRDILYRYTSELTPDDVELLALFAYSEAALRGTGTVVDFFYLHHGGNEYALRLARAAQTVGLRLVIARSMIDAEDAPAAYRETTRQAVDNFRELRGALAGNRLVTAIPAPHSPHRASAEMVVAGAQVAAEYDCPWHIHLAEARSENEMTTGRYGLTPLRWLDSLGALDGRCCLVHGVWLDEEEIALVAENGVALVHCPSSNMFLGDGVAPLDHYLRHGVPIALGSDSGSANNRISVFAEMRQTALLRRVVQGDQSALDARTVFAMGTASGRRITGLALGSLEAGATADFVGLDPQALSLQPVNNLLNNVVFSLEQEAIREVYVADRNIVHEGQLKWAGAGELPARLRELTRRLGLGS